MRTRHHPRRSLLNVDDLRGQKTRRRQIRVFRNSTGGHGLWRLDQAESARSNVHSADEATGCHGRNAGAAAGRDCKKGEGATPFQCDEKPRKARVERDISPEPTPKEEFRIQGSPRTASRQLMEHLHQQQIERASARERMYQNFLPL